jgi:glycosyltransferase involved in cell wall biosynthesis
VCPRNRGKSRQRTKNTLNPCHDNQKQSTFHLSITNLSQFHFIFYRKVNLRDKYKVLILSSALCIGGAEEVIYQIASNIDQNDFDIAVCYLSECGPIGDKIIQKGIRVYGFHRTKIKVYNYFTAFHLGKIIKQHRFNIVHSHDLHSLMDASICKLFFPRLTHVHTFHYGNYPFRTTKYKLLESLFWRLPNKLIAVGKAQKNSLELTYSIPKNKIHKIYNGVSSCHNKIDQELLHVIKSNNFHVIGSISTLTEQKGISYFLKAIHILSKHRNDFIALIVGDGPLLPQLQSEAQKLAINRNTFFLGWIPEAPSRILPLFDIFVQSSFWEAMSMVVIEAMSLGKASIVTTVGENQYIFKNGINGFLVPPGDAVSIADRLNYLLDNPNDRDRIGTESKKVFDSQFTASHMVNNYENIYKDLIVDR